MMNSFDPEIAIARVGSKAVFLRMLGMFIPSYGRIVPLVRGALDAADWELAKRSAHTLKGAAATVGAAPLSGFSAQLENAIAAGEAGKYSQLIAQMDAELSRVIVLIEAYQSANAVEPGRA